VDGADAVLAPPLDRWAERAYVAGRLANTPADVARWIREPQAIVAGNAMPDLGVPRRTGARHGRLPLHAAVRTLAS
jgi:cytochrome c